MRLGDYPFAIVGDRKSVGLNRVRVDESDEDTFILWSVHHKRLVSAIVVSGCRIRYDFKVTPSSRRMAVAGTQKRSRRRVKNSSENPGNSQRYGECYDNQLVPVQTRTMALVQQCYEDRRET